MLKKHLIFVKKVRGNGDEYKRTVKKPIWICELVPIVRTVQLGPVHNEQVRIGSFFIALPLPMVSKYALPDIF